MGARCLVVGDGAVELLCAYLLQRFEPSSVTVLGVRTAQADLAARAGTATFTLESPEGPFDLIIEAAGQRHSIESAFVSPARRATIILLGLPAHGTGVEVAPDDLVNHDVTVHASFSYTSAAWVEVVNLLNEGQAAPSFLFTHRYHLDQWPRALEALRAVPADQPRGKVLIWLGDEAAA